MPDSRLCSRYVIDAQASRLTYEAKSSLQFVSGNATQMSGYVEAAWDEHGTLLSDPPPQMHMEIPVSGLLSGSAAKDREIWNLIDVGRFPLVVADLQSIKLLYGTSVYHATGEITLAGRTRSYAGQLLVVADERGIVSVRGDLDLDIRDYGLSPPRMLFVRIEPVITVHLSLVAMRDN